MSVFYHRLQWLPLPYFIQFRSLYHQYHQQVSHLNHLHMIFGWTSYCTRTPPHFANIPTFFSSTQHFFHFSCQFYEFVVALKQYCDSLYWFHIVIVVIWNRLDFWLFVLFCNLCCNKTIFVTCLIVCMCVCVCGVILQQGIMALADCSEFKIINQISRHNLVCSWAITQNFKG